MLAMAAAEPVVVGIMLKLPARARRRSLRAASTTLWSLVTLWTVVTLPCTMPKVSCRHLDQRRARQFVVQEAAVTTRCRAGS